MPAGAEQRGRQRHALEAAAPSPCQRAVKQAGRPCHILFRHMAHANGMRNGSSTHGRRMWDACGRHLRLGRFSVEAASTPSPWSTARSPATCSASRRVGVLGGGRAGEEGGGVEGRKQFGACHCKEGAARSSDSKANTLCTSSPGSRAACPSHSDCTAQHHPALFGADTTLARPLHAPPSTQPHHTPPCRRASGAPAPRAIPWTPRRRTSPLPPPAPAAPPGLSRLCPSRSVARWRRKRLRCLGGGGAGGEGPSVGGEACVGRHSVSHEEGAVAADDTWWCHSLAAPGTGGDGGRESNVCAHACTRSEATLPARRACRGMPCAVPREVPMHIMRDLDNPQLPAALSALSSRPSRGR